MISVCFIFVHYYSFSLLSPSASPPSSCSLLFSYLSLLLLCPQLYTRPHPYPPQGPTMSNSVQHTVPNPPPTHYTMPYAVNQRPQNLPLEGHEMLGSPVESYGSPVSTPQAQGYRHPPRYSYHPQSSPAPSPHGTVSRGGREEGGRREGERERDRLKENFRNSLNLEKGDLGT